MKFLIDMPLSPALAQWLVGEGHDALHACDLELDRAADTEIIERARQELRTVITADLDYPRLLALSEASEPSLILFRRGNWSDQEIVKRMQQILASTDATDTSGSEGFILVVDPNRVRRRRLPISTSNA